MLRSSPARFREITRSSGSGLDLAIQAEPVSRAKLAPRHIWNCRAVCGAIASKLTQRCNALLPADATHQIVTTCPFVKQVPAVGKCIAPARPGSGVQHSPGASTCRG